MVVIPWGVVVEPSNREESVLLEPLLDYLRRTGRIRPSTAVKMELPWNGRRVDLATLSATRVASAYELKLSSVQRGIEQAAYNRLAFDRSWVVTTGKTGESGVREARALGVGILSLIDGAMRVVVPAQMQPRTNRVVRARLLSKLSLEGGYLV